MGLALRRPGVFARVRGVLARSPISQPRNEDVMNTRDAHDTTEMRDETLEVERQPPSMRRARPPLPFAPLHPGKIASMLLALHDPVPTLERWLEEAPLPELAKVLHALVREIDRGPLSSPLAVRHIELNRGDRTL